MLFFLCLNNFYKCLVEMLQHFFCLEQGHEIGQCSRSPFQARQNWWREQLLKMFLLHMITGDMFALDRHFCQRVSLTLACSIPKLQEPSEIFHVTAHLLLGICHLPALLLSSVDLNTLYKGRQQPLSCVPCVPPTGSIKVKATCLNSTENKSWKCRVDDGSVSRGIGTGGRKKQALFPSTWRR